MNTAPEVTAGPAGGAGQGGSLRPPASGVTVRMYRQGLGDCFLLAFATSTPGEAFYMLIDCGVILGTENASTMMTKVAQDIQAATGGDIHLLVATHEHWDHLSGFLQARPVFEEMRIHNLWLAWTEDPSDELATKLRAEFHANREALRVALTSVQDHKAVQPIMQVLEFFGDTRQTFDAPALAAAGGTTNGANTTGAALQALRSFIAKAGGNLVYRHPDEPPLNLPAIGALTVANARIYVLGPPHDEQTLKRINPSASGQETYLDSPVLTRRDAFFMAAPAQGQDDELGSQDYPFDARLKILRDQAQTDPFFQRFYGFPAQPGGNGQPSAASTSTSDTDDSLRLAWRRIDEDYLGAAGEFALQLDSYTNNTSLALAIELIDSGKVLFFVADAQVGNWLSWDALKWPVQDQAGTSRQVAIGDLLARAVFYKVGHHGSHNATIRALKDVKKGLELMTSPDLVAMIPVNHEMALKKHWGQMPYDPLLQRLAAKTRSRIWRIDDPYPKPQPPGMSDADWQAMKNQCEETELYFQLTVQ